MGGKDERSRDSSNTVRKGAELARLTEADRELAVQLVNRARSEGLNLVGENGLLKRLVKLVLEGALEAEMIEHLGYRRPGSAGPDQPDRAGLPAGAHQPPFPAPGGGQQSPLPDRRHRRRGRCRRILHHPACPDRSRGPCTLPG